MLEIANNIQLLHSSSAATLPEDTLGALIHDNDVLTQQKSDDESECENQIKIDDTLIGNFYLSIDDNEE